MTVKTQTQPVILWISAWAEHTKSRPAICVVAGDPPRPRQFTLSYGLGHADFYAPDLATAELAKAEFLALSATQVAEMVEAYGGRRTLVPVVDADVLSRIAENCSLLISQSYPDFSEAERSDFSAQLQGLAERIFRLPVSDQQIRDVAIGLFLESLDDHSAADLMDLIRDWTINGTDAWGKLSRVQASCHLAELALDFDPAELVLERLTSPN
jgi:hypothetical protein